MIVTETIGANTYTYDYRLSDTHHGQYDSGFHAWLVERREADDWTGDTDYGGAVLYGKRVDYWDSCGFHSLETFVSVEKARAAYEAWCEEYDRPERFDVELRDYRYLLKRGTIPWSEDETRYRHALYPGVAWVVVCDAVEGWADRSDDHEYTPIEGQVVAHMVGDDSYYLVDVTDLTALTEDEYCAGCGQIGCDWH